MSMKYEGWTKQIMLLSVLSVTAGCNLNVERNGQVGDDSILFSVPGMPNDIKGIVNYNLFCGSNVNSLSSQTPILGKSIEAEKLVRFSAPNVKVNDYCALTVTAKDTNAVKDKYTWTSKQATVGLFYGSTVAQVTADRRLKLGLYEVYEDPNAPHFNATFSAIFQGGVDLSSLAANAAELKCGIIRRSMSWSKTAEGRGNFIFKLPESAYTNDTACQLAVTINEVAYESDIIQVKKSVLSYEAALKAKVAADKAGGDITVAVENVKKDCIYNAENFQCESKVSNAGAISGLEAFSSALNGSWEVCRKDSDNRPTKSFYIFNPAAKIVKLNVTKHISESCSDAGQEAKESLGSMEVQQFNAADAKVMMLTLSFVSPANATQFYLATIEGSALNLSRSFSEKPEASTVFAKNSQLAKKP